jgi:hypothetical protein
MSRIPPIAISAVIAVVVMAVASPTPSHRNGDIRAYIATIIRIGIRRDITPRHGAEDSPTEQNHYYALHGVPLQILSIEIYVFLV